MDREFKLGGIDSLNSWSDYKKFLQYEVDNAGNSIDDKHLKYFTDITTINSKIDESEVLFTKVKRLEHFISIKSSDLLEAIQKIIQPIDHSEEIYHKWNDFLKNYSSGGIFKSFEYGSYKSKLNFYESLVYTPGEYYQLPTTQFSEEYFNNIKRKTRSISPFCEYFEAFDIISIPDFLLSICTNLDAIICAEKLRKVYWQHAKLLVLATYIPFPPDIREQYRHKISIFFKNMDDESGDSFSVYTTNSKNYFLTQNMSHVLKKRTYWQT